MTLYDAAQPLLPPLHGRGRRRNLSIGLPTSRQLQTAGLTVGRFVLHFAEMCAAMFVGMAAFMAIPGVMELPRPLHLLGMAIAMTAPMVGWMRVRGHGWRQGDRSA